jgi:uncharacterized lipoprotein YmbA
MNIRIPVLAMGLLVLASCGTSPKVDYHSLSVTAGPQERITPSVKPVQVSAVHIPASLDRKEMVTQTGPNAVDISDRNRWSAPLGDMARRVLALDLQSRLAEGTVVVPDLPAASDTAQIVVSLLQFGPDPNGKAVLVGGWSVTSGRTGKVVMRHDVSLSSNLRDASADAAAAAMSDLLGQLAKNIAEGLARKS